MEASWCDTNMDVVLILFNSVIWYFRQHENSLSLYLLQSACEIDLLLRWVILVPSQNTSGAETMVQFLPIYTSVISSLGA